MSLRALLAWLVALVCFTQASAAPVNLSPLDVLNAVASDKGRYTLTNNLSQFGALADGNISVTFKGVLITAPNSFIKSAAIAGYSSGPGASGNCTPVYEGLGLCKSKTNTGIVWRGPNSIMLEIEPIPDPVGTCGPATAFRGQVYNNEHQLWSGYCWRDANAMKEAAEQYKPDWKSSYFNYDDFPDGKMTASQFNATIVSLIYEWYNDAKPDIDELKRQGFTFNTEVTGKFGGVVDTSTGQPVDTTDSSSDNSGSQPSSNPTFDPDSPYKSGSGLACDGKYSGLSLVEGALAKWFMPCTDWGDKFTSLRTGMADKFPFGVIKWLKIDMMGSNFSSACTMGGMKIGGNDGEIYPGVPFPSINMCNPVTEWIHDRRWMMSLVLWVAFASFVFRTLMQ